MNKWWRSTVTLATLVTVSTPILQAQDGSCVPPPPPSGCVEQYGPTVALQGGKVVVQSDVLTISGGWVFRQQDCVFDYPPYGDYGVGDSEHVLTYNLGTVSDPNARGKIRLTGGLRNYSASRLVRLASVIRSKPDPTLGSLLQDSLFGCIRKFINSSFGTTSGERRYRDGQVVVGVRGSLTLPGISLFENSPAWVVTQTIFPSAIEAPDVGFAFAFENVGDGDWLEVTLGEDVIWTGLGTDFDVDTVYEAQIPGQALLGRSGVLAFVLRSVGSPNAVVHIASLDDVTFTPDPPVATPTTTIVASPLANAAGWHRNTVTLTISALMPDATTADIQEIVFTTSGAVTGSGTLSGANGQLQISAEGTTELSYYARTISGVVENLRTLSVRIDRTSPIVIFGTARTAPNANGWYRQQVQFPFSVVDQGSGVDSALGEATVSAEGSGVFTQISVTDRAGNQGTSATPGVNIDRTPPTATCSADPSKLFPPKQQLVPVTASVSSRDALSGVSRIVLSGVSILQGGGDPLKDIVGWTVGTADFSGQLRATRIIEDRLYGIRYTSADQAGNVGSCQAVVTVPRANLPTSTCTAGCSGT